MWGSGTGDFVARRRVGSRGLCGCG
uniref:Uncharacterized protein n=1 Tax=Arundo donax TaxID=35708 RepID=A0A0A8ZJX9_ARUDO